jgi:hypothetical protein
VVSIRDRVDKSKGRLARIRSIEIEFKLVYGEKIGLIEKTL